MKRNLLIAFAAASVIFASCGETKTEAPKVEVPKTPLMGDAKLSIDVTASKVMWKGEMLGLYSHEGTIGVKDGSVMLKDGKVTGGMINIDMTKITPTDANYSEKDDHTAANLVGHLSSPDFFDIANNPTATFAITSVNGNTVNGNLTVRGKTNPEVVEITSVSLDGENVKISGKMKFNRQNYSVAFAMPVKDKVLSDDINLTLELVAKK
jgi:polyisoprenoid-binding protein YceI